MQPQYILISGSATPDCPREKLERAHQFVTAVTKEIVRTGSGVTVLVGREPVSDAAGPTIFDWTVLRAVAQVLDDSDENANRVLAHVITAADSFTKRFSPENAQLIQRLQMKGAIDVQHIDKNRYYGGSYRNKQAALSDALIAVGGGKGTYNIGDRMLADGKPVMPMDLSVGARSNDGDGALQLLSEMKTDQRTFLPRSHTVVNLQLYALSLEQPVASIRRIATAVAKILAIELEVSDRDNDKNDSSKGGFLQRVMRRTPKAAQTAYYSARAAEVLSGLLS